MISNVTLLSRQYICTQRGDCLPSTGTHTLFPKLNFIGENLTLCNTRKADIIFITFLLSSKGLILIIINSKCIS